MPQRFLRPGLTTSPRWNALDWQAQSFYVRLITLVDDFGRYYADYRILRSHVFPMGDAKGGDVSVKTIESICKQLSASGMVSFYANYEGQQFLKIERWEETVRAKKSKYPDPEECEQMFADDNNCLSPSPSSSPSSSPLHHRHKPSVGAADEIVSGIYEAYPKKVGRPLALAAIRRAMSRGVTAEFLQAKTLQYASIRGGDLSYVPNPATWFNQERYNDPTETWRPQGNGITPRKSSPTDLSQKELDDIPISE